MIQKGTILRVIDNSGAKYIACVHVCGGYRKRYANTGDIVIASIKTIKYKTRLKVKKGGVVKALVVRTKKFSSLVSPIKNNLKFFKNEAIILSNSYKLVGTRIFGGLDYSFRYTKFLKITALSAGYLQ